MKSKSPVWILILSAVMALVLLPAALPAVSATSTASPVSALLKGKILYTVQQTAENNIVYTLDQTGTTVQIISRPLAWGMSWSPDGMSLLLNRQENGRGQIYRVDTTGHPQKHLSDSSVHSYSPLWSPTGDTIAYAEDNVQKDTARLMLMAPDGRDMRVLYRGMAFLNAWSPDGSQVIVTLDGKPALVDVSTQAAAPLHISGFEDQPMMVTDWSQDGKWIAFTLMTPAASQLYIASIDGTSVHPALADTSFQSADNRMLKWSSDASSFVFISTRDTASGEIYVANGDGTQVERLTYSEPHLNITTLAYWTSKSTSALPAVLPGGFQWTPLRDFNRLTVNPEDPASVTFAVMTKLFSGKLNRQSELICPELQDTYEQTSQEADALLADFDLTNTVITVTRQDGTAADIQLSGTMSLLISGTRSDYPASLLPVRTHPITRLHLIYQGGWKMCSPF